MSFKHFQGSFVQRPTIETIYQEVFSKICMSFINGNLDSIQRSIEQFEDMVIPIADKEYFEDLKKLEDEYNKEFNERNNLYLKQVQKALCPDVIVKPDPRSKDYFRKKQRLLIDVLKRRGLWLTIRQEDTF